MTDLTRVLIVEDLPTDAELNEREVRQVLPSCEFLRVETREDFLAALEGFRPDIILSDFKLPRFDGLTALNLARDLAPEVPFIVITGSMNEDTAVECMKAGAWDYVIKEHLRRLGPAVLNALGQKRERQERRRAEEMARENMELYRKLFEDHAAIKLMIDPDSGRIIDANDAAAEFYGWTREQLRRMTVLELNTLPPGEVRKAMETVLSRKRFHFEFRHRRADGSVRDVEVFSSRIELKGKNILHSIIHDITDRKQAERALRESDARLKMALAAANQGIYDLDIRTGEAIVTPEYATMLGYDPAEFRETNDAWIERLHPDDREPVSRNYREYVAGIRPEYRVEFRQRTRTGGWKWVLSIGRIVEWDADGHPVRMLGTHTDITSRKEAEAEHARLETALLQAQKMEAMGQLAGGIAHDFNNVLNAVVGFAGLLQMQMDRGDPLRHFADEIVDAGMRGAALTLQILAFSRKQVLDMKPLRINGVIQGLEIMLRRLVREDIRLELGLCDHPLKVLADENQIGQVLINLVANARDAVSSGGRIRISTEPFEMDAAYIAMHGYGKVGAYALLSVADDGRGMDAGTKARLFEPFFTTKEVGKGTGLGLAVVHGVVKQHNGFINVYSEAGHGTVFRVYLPLTTQNAAPEETRQQGWIRGGTEMLLLAEDDASLRRMSASLLKHHGYVVLEAADGAEALRIFSEHRDRICLVLLDGIMPSRNGKEVFDEIRKARPDMQAIIMSGYAEEMFAVGGVPAGAFFLQKPVKSDVLLKKVREVLDRERPHRL